MKTSCLHSTKQLRKNPCTLPELWSNDPQLADYQDVLEDVMAEVYDWADLFDMVSTRAGMLEQS